ncbi:MAG: two-component system response regulator [Sulfuricurvum sp. PD_MW2]|jgi:DNA-binding response OmpR family regulator|uniref:response regulator transcription factor n=1 Tax=Sulfuricurvum sp. PD_MW2 TaxID=2027917 RepID=UPI000C06367F|nr:response regulator transcription factor [Sulfuricurvum sp. PD_MW2]PHM18524.1 MAG: two-component system response regulator [Sulfuricurvum sp. PD_MW2]
MRVLLLEDEYMLRVSITEFLEEMGYEVVGFSNGEKAFDAIYETHFDLYLLDVNVPGMNGFELLRSIRKEGNKTPAIFLTSMVNVSDLQEGYKSGCCDYVRKPFDLTELQIRIMHALKSYYHDGESKIDFGSDLIYDTENFTLTHGGENISLSKTEKEIFTVLLKHTNQVVSVEMFQDEIWGEYVDPANIRVQINNLRKKLPVDIIQNRRGLGYIIER